MRIFITGGTGFIGRKVVKRLIKDHDCIVLTRRAAKSDAAHLHYVQTDLRDEAAVKAAFDKWRPQVLLHLAWGASGSYATSSPINEEYVAMSGALVRAFLHSGGEYVAAAGSCFEYGVTESILTEDSPCRPATLYGKCKNEAHTLMRRECNECGARMAYTRIFYVYGPGEDSRKLITSAIETLQSGGTFECLAPNNEVDYIHADDAADMLCAIAVSPDASGVYNICTGKGTRVGGVVQRIAEYLDASNRIVLRRNAKAVRVIGDNSAIMRLGAFNLRDVETGLYSYSAIANAVRAPYSVYFYPPPPEMR